LNGNVIINKNGTLSPSNSVLIEGFWGWQRVGDVLPDELVPPADANTRMIIAKEADVVTKPAPVEKIHIQTDRPWYLTGDTAWMKIYVVDEHNKPSANSKICFVELIDGNKHIVKNLRLPVNAGMAWGEIALNDSLVKKGAYVLRVYTNSTPKTNNSFFYKPIRVADLNSATANIKTVNGAKQQQLVTDSLKVQFFAEGGTLVTDINSRIGITITSSGKPIGKISGYIADEFGSHIARFETNDQGISAFNLKPLKQGKYWVVATLPGAPEKRFALPQPQQAGVAMAVKQNSDDIAVHLNAANVNRQIPLKLIVKAQNRVLYQTEKLLAETADSIIISKAELPEGILQFDLYDDNNTYIAGRMLYNQNKTQQLKISVVPNQPRYQLHNKVDLNIAITDHAGNPVVGAFSVAVNNEADVTGDLNDRSIFTNLLMPGTGMRKLKQYDITTLTANQQREIDDALLTMKPEQATADKAANKQSLIQTDSTFFAINGQVNTPKGKPAPSSIVGVFFPAGGPVLTATSENNGRFTINNVPVKRGDPYYIVAKDKNKDLFVAVDKYEPPVIPDDILADTAELNEFTNYVIKRIADLKAGKILGTELKEVLIKDKKVEPTLKQKVLQNSSNMGGKADQVLTFIDLLGCTSSTLAECLAIKLNAVTVSIDSLHRTQLFARGRNNGPMAVFVDGIERPEALTSLSSSQVASVEVLKGSNAVAYGLRSGNGVIVITTKGGGLDYWAYEQEYYVPGSTRTPGIQRYRFESGFDIASEFYASDYNKPQPKTIDKWRPTIYWNPNVITNVDGTAKLSYFTNSAPGTYSVTIEGIDSNGRIARQVFKYTVGE